MEDSLTVVEDTPINSLAAGQVNGQTFTATSSDRTVCVQVTNFAAIQSDAEYAGEGGSLLGPWVAGHPFADGSWWNVLPGALPDGSCPSMTWVYVNGYLVPDNSPLW